MRFIVISLLLIATIGAAGYLGWQRLGAQDPSHDQSFRLVTVEQGDLDLSVLSPGVVGPENRLEIRPPIAGRVEEVLVQEGAQVTKGQVLAWMSSTERAALVDAARARGSTEVQRWEEFYKPTPIMAPIAGTIIKRNTEPGQTFAAQDAVFVLSDRLIVVAQVDETDIAQVSLNQAVRITLDAYPDHTVAGTVFKIAFDAKTVNNVTTYEVEVLPQEVPSFMRSGMTANVVFQLAEKKGVLTLPAEAIRYKEGAAYVLLPGDNATAHGQEKPVQLGLNSGKLVEVVSGLHLGQHVVVAQLRSAQAARSTPFSPFAARRPH